ncbi:MAG: hypothetical protein QM744_04180 [Mesorhizobium sp.]
MKRYKVTTAYDWGSADTVLFEANSELEAKDKAVAALPDYKQGSLKFVIADEVGNGLKRVMP